MNGVVHFEIPADDLKRANRFYSAVFGWKVEKVKGMEDQYHTVYTVEVDKRMMPTRPGAINGGLMKRNGPTDRNPVLVIDVPSLGPYLKKVEKAGGKVVMPKMKVMDMGWYARVKDTEGNIIGVWETIPRKP